MPSWLEGDDTLRAQPGHTEGEVIFQLMHDCIAAEYSHLASHCLFWSKRLHLLSLAMPRVKCCTADKLCCISCGRCVFAAVISLLLCLEVTSLFVWLLIDLPLMSKPMSPVSLPPCLNSKGGLPEEVNDKDSVQLTCIA